MHSRQSDISHTIAAYNWMQTEKRTISNGMKRTPASDEA